MFGGRPDVIALSLRQRARVAGNLIDLDYPQVALTQ